MTLRCVLDPASLVERHPGISEGLARALVEAACVTLERYHAPPTPVTVRTADRRLTVVLEWPAPTARAHRAWADRARATEWAAEALAISCLDMVCGLVVVERAQRGTRADYYVGVPGDDLESASLLEVAGIDDGSVDNLVRRKVRQVEQNPHRLPALAVVVRIRDALAIIHEVRRSDR